MNFKKILSMFTFLYFSTSYCSAEEVWRITSLDWQPYSGERLKGQGHSVEKLRKALERKGITLVVEFYPWTRSQQKAKLKNYVGYFPAWPEEVQEGFVASSAVDWSWVGILTQSGRKIVFDNINDLFKKYRVGIVESYVYPQTVANAMKNHPDNVEPAPDEISLLKKLSVGRSDVAITDPNVTEFLARENNISNIVPVKMITRKELVVAFRKGDDNKKRMQILEESLRSMDASRNTSVNRQ